MIEALSTKGGPAFGKKKILIFHTSVGLGHMFIAKNIAWHLERAGFAVKLADIGQVQQGRFEHVTVCVHRFINKYFPVVWGWLYNWGHYAILPFRTAIAGFNAGRARQLIVEFEPDLVISTQTTSSAVVAYLKKQGIYKNLFAIAFSDYHLHPYWLYREADFYLANTEEQKRQMIARGISADKITVCGITLPPKPEVDIVAVKRKFGIKPENRVVLVGTGSLGIGFPESGLKDLASLPGVKIIFSCGKNQELFNRVKSFGYQNVIPLGFYEPMAELYAVADIFVGKPGGLSTAESLQWGLPLLVVFTLPGQEGKNYEYLADKNLVMATPKNLAAAVKEELSARAFRNQLLHNPAVAAITGRSSSLIEAVVKRL